MKLVDNKKKYKYADGTDRPDDKIIPYLDNEFVTGFKEDRFYYSKDFDVAMYKKIQEEGMTYVGAYNALGFDTKILGENRANAAGKRVMEKARDHKLFTTSETSYDGSVPLEMMGQLTPEEERAYLKARNHYLEEMLLTQKKCDPNWRATLYNRGAGNQGGPLSYGGCIYKQAETESEWL